MYKERPEARDGPVYKERPEARDGPVNKERPEARDGPPWPGVQGAATSQGRPAMARCTRSGQKPGPGPVYKERPEARDGPVYKERPEATNGPAMAELLPALLPCWAPGGRRLTRRAPQFSHPMIYTYTSCRLPQTDPRGVPGRE